MSGMVQLSENTQEDHANKRQKKEELVAEQCKDKEEFRNYDQDNDRQETVSQHYRLMRTNQTVEYVLSQHKKYSFEGGGRAKMTVREAFEVLEGYVDSSDPDTELPNMVHMLQTAESIRKAGHPDWFQLVGLIHDMGKMMFMFGGRAEGQEGTADGHQWALGGDTWAVGCRIPDCAVFPEFNSLNPDMANPKHSTPLGMYEPKCGLDNLMFAWGHDEYMYRMLVANGASLPQEALWMVRYHSAYPWHTGGAYAELLAEEDAEKLTWVREFNKFDLYTKDVSNVLGVEELWAYYQSLVDKYMPGKLMW